MSYHDVFITTARIPRTKLSDLSYGYLLTCNRVGGWQLWIYRGPDLLDQLIGGEFDEDWLIVDINGCVIIDSCPESEKSK